jgi:hypothetical protein
VLLAERFDIFPTRAWHFTWWALIVIVLGVGGFLRRRHAGDVGNGVMFVLLGTWFLLVSNDQFGLTWRNSWPLALVAAGAGTIAKAIASRWLPDEGQHRKEERHA